jgi:hypothetical protein
MSIAEPVSRGSYRPLIALWLSLIIHLAVILAGALWLRSAPALPGIEPVREVGIVLVTHAHESDIRYFDVGGEESSDSPAAATASASLPDAAEPPAIGSIALPGELQSLPESIAPGLASVEGASRGGPVLDSTATIAEILAEDARRPRPKGPEGPPGEVSIFGAAGLRGHSFVFVVDRSNSMEGAIAAAHDELLAALDGLESNHSFAVVAYNQGTAWLGQRKLLPTTDESRAACRSFMENLAAYGATDHERAVISALQLKPDALLLLTDGDPALNAAQRKRIRDEARGHTKITCIQFGRVDDDDPTRKALEIVARENGGSYRNVDLSRRK